MANSVDPDSEPSHQDLQCLQNKQQQQKTTTTFWSAELKWLTEC